MKSFWLAWQFLTLLPSPRYREVSAEELGRSQAWYPLVGLAMGGLLYGLFMLLKPTPLGDGIIASLLLIGWVALSGALHLDGLADVADAWVGAHGERERALSIMKDPTSGPMGVTAVVLLLLLKFTLLQQMQTLEMIILVLAPALARGLVPLLFLGLPYLREQGLGRALKDHLPFWAVLFSWLLLLALAYYLVGALTGWLMLVLLGLWLLLHLVFRSRFGGLTGDMVGAAIEITEVALLLAVLLLNF